jgi:nicotinamide riboside transporter PnuC
MTEPWYAYLIVAAALAGTVLNVRRSRWCWPVWIGSNAASAAYLAASGLWSQGALQATFLALSVWGWISWRQP